MPRTKLSYRTTTPWEDGAISPLTDKSRAVPLFGDTPLIQDIIEGKGTKINDIHSRGQWAMDRDEDVEKNYREEGDEFMLRHRLLEDRARALSKNVPKKYRWYAEMEDGTELEFFDEDTAIKTLDSSKRPYRRLFRRLAQVSQRPDIIAKALESCVVVESISTDGTMEIGAGFCVAPGIFVTCAHVIRRYDRASMPSGGFGGNFTIMLKMREKKAPAELLAINYIKDVAVVKSSMNAPSLNMAVEDVAVGEDVFAIGNPRAFEAEVSSGIVGGKNRKVLLHEGAPRYLFTDAHVLPGNSGGPLLLYRTGEVIGMMAMIVGGGQGLYGLNAALPARDISGFLKDNGILAKNNTESNKV
jgi:S1-C subfamily serine protease